MKHLLIATVLILGTMPAWAQKVGGNFNLRLADDPTTLHPVMSTDVYAGEVQSFILDTLLTHDLDTYKYQPALAESYKISKNGLEFTFKLRDGAKFHNGQPVTVEDVKFSYDAVFIPDFHAAHLIPYFENISKVEILDAHTIKFITKKKYFLNLDTIGTMSIIPKSVYSDTKVNLNKTLIGSGPYVFDKWERGSRIIIKRNPDWWGWNVSYYKNLYNFETVTFRIVKDDTVAFEMLKKGDIDLISPMTGEQYVVKAVGPEWGTKVIKVKAENKTGKGFNFIGWNLNSPLFKDKEVRKALAMLINRPVMNEKFRYNMSYLQNGPIDTSSDYADPNIKPIPFDPKKALEILKRKGWSDAEKKGVLQKMIDGKKQELHFTIICATDIWMKYLTMFKEDAKKVGVDIEIKLLEWNTFVKLLDERKFDAIAMAWGGVIDTDPKQIWHSTSDSKGGSNFVGYKSPEADKLIDQAREELDRGKRIKILRKFFDLVADDAPYAWLFSNRYDLYAHQGRIKKIKDTYKYSTGVDHWWAE